MNNPIFTPPQAVRPSPTAEQVAIVEHTATGQDLKIAAFAGSGKTTTLRQIAERTHRRGLAIVFNKSAELDLKARMPSNIECRTTHSLAWRHCAKSGYAPGRLNQNFVVAWHPELKSTAPIFQRLIARGLKNFHQSADPEPMLAHVPEPNRLIVDPAEHLPADQSAAFRAKALAWIAHIWGRQKNPFDDIAIGGDGYVKIWAVSAPCLAADFVMLDEAQDTNPAVQGVFAAQPCQKIAVGDPHQQLYAWRGAVDALARLPWAELPLTQSWRFGENDLATTASRLLGALGETRRLRGNPQAYTSVGASCPRPDAILCRTNANCFQAAADAAETGARPFAGEKLAKELKGLADDVERIEAGIPAISPDLFGIASLRGLIEFAEMEEGAHLKTFAGLIVKHGVFGLRQLLASFAPRADQADIAISTAHRAKGLEWPAVRLGGDFARGDRITDAERRLFYVAATRAKTALIVDPAMLAEYSS